MVRGNAAKSVMARKSQRRRRRKWRYVTPSRPALLSTVSAQAPTAITQAAMSRPPTDQLQHPAPFSNDPLTKHIVHSLGILLRERLAPKGLEQLQPEQPQLRRQPTKVPPVHLSSASQPEDVSWRSRRGRSARTAQFCSATSSPCPSATPPGESRTAATGLCPVPSRTP